MLEVGAAFWIGKGGGTVKDESMMSPRTIRKLLVLLAAAGCFAFAVVWSGFSQPDPLKLAVGTRPGSEALVFALAQGEPLPLNEFRLIEMTGATAISRALENGVIDAAVISVDEALQMNDSGHPVRIVLVLEESKGADVLMVPPQVTKLEQLKGLRIGAEVRSSSHYLLVKALQKGGLNLDDVELLPFTGREVATALRADEVDALVVTEPDAQRIVPGEMTRLFDSASLEQPILRVLAVRETVWEAKKHVLRKLAQRYFAQQARMNVEDAAFVAFFARRTRLEEEATRRCLAHVNFPDAAEMAVWLKQGLISRVMEAKNRDMTAAGLLGVDLLELPHWDAFLLETSVP